ncbi:MAG TPA: GNAT family N-acetyltransferase [Anaerolineales bacterium]|nr:GNAT family N-acetyltransferase [Anaerolineales bacterium]
MADRFTDFVGEAAHQDDWLDGFEIRHLKNDELAGLEWGGEFTHFRRQFEAAYHEYLQGNGIPWIAVSRQDGQIVGQVFVLLSSRLRKELADGRRRAYLYAIRVKPDYRGRGLGGRMMAVVESDLAARGYQSATLNVARDNPNAQRFYHRCGYRIVAPEHGQWSYIDHTGRRRHVDEPAWRMEKELG